MKRITTRYSTCATCRPAPRALSRFIFPSRVSYSSTLALGFDFVSFQPSNRFLKLGVKSIILPRDPFEIARLHFWEAQNFFLPFRQLVVLELRD